MRQRGTNIRRALVALAFMGSLLTLLADSGVSRPDTGEAKAQTPVLKPRLAGVVLTTNDEPVANAIVTIKGVLAGRGAVYVFDAPDCNRQSVTGADGTFTFDRVAAATKFQGIVVAPGYELQPFRDADAGGKPLRIRLIPAPAGGDPHQTVLGRVVDTAGKPVEGAKIQVYMIHTEQDWHSGGGLSFTDKKGGFVFLPREKLIACDFSIEANGYVWRSFSEVHPGVGTNEYVLSQGTSITGRLMKDGKPVLDAGIGIYGVKGGDFLDSFSVVTDGTGRFIFSGVPANEEFYLFSIMRSLRELGTLSRRHVRTGDEGTRIDLGDLNLAKGYTISGRVQMTDGKPTAVGAFTIARTELTPTPGQTPSVQEESNRSFYGLEHSFDDCRADPGKDGRFEFTGVPGETVSIFLMLKPFDTLSPRNISSDGKGFRLLGMVVSNKTDLVIEIEPHHGQVFPPARDYQTLSRRPLQGAETAIAK
ncbi:MAG TPA: carboxypeptidase regulatory-like domain-containing protein [Verrucomicrobiae bacterium]|nr:carboxypeptidase regulatory-like domain-containing protein [Verrucomicrobiae bacterium]